MGEIWQTGLCKQGRSRSVLLMLVHTVYQDPSASFRHITVKPHSSNFLIISTIFLNVWIFRLVMVILRAPSWENLLLPYANNKGADQPAHPRSLISTFVVRCLDSIIPLLAISKHSRLASFWSWAARFESNLVGNPEERFSRDVAPLLTYLCLASDKRDIGKQCSPRSDITCTNSKGLTRAFAVCSYYILLA